MKSYLSTTFTNSYIIVKKFCITFYQNNKTIKKKLMMAMICEAKEEWRCENAFNIECMDSS
jgi:hypothetical protein